MPMIKRTSRQAKAAYHKKEGRPSEWETRHLENLAAADRSDEEPREKEKRKENKKKREEKKRREREARLKSGI